MSDQRCNHPARFQSEETGEAEEIGCSSCSPVVIATVYRGREFIPVLRVWSDGRREKLSGS